MFTAIISLIGAAFLACLGWAFKKIERLDTRVAVLEALQSPLMVLLNARFDAVEDRLSRIEDSIDHKGQ